MIGQILKAVAVASLVVGLAACERAPAPESAKTERRASSGPGAAKKVGENTYQNATLGLTITAPTGWYVADTGQMARMMDAGTEITTSRMDANTRAMVDGSIERTSSIFTFMQVPPGSPVEYNPAIMGVTEDIGMLPGISRGSDYFYHARRLFAQSAVPTNISETYSERTIGGQSFDRMDLEMGTPGGSVSQRYYAARKGKLIFVIIQSYRTPEELAQLDAVLDSITLDW